MNSLSSFSGAAHRRKCILFYILSFFIFFFCKNVAELKALHSSSGKIKKLQYIQGEIIQYFNAILSHAPFF